MRQQNAEFDKLSRILRRTYSADELRSEAWIVACDLEAGRQHPLDFNDARDQSLVLACLRHHISAARRGRINAVSIDRSAHSDSYDGERSALHLFLAASEDSDPLVWFQASEEQVDWTAVALASYSELAAYVILFIRFEWDRTEVASCLCVSVGVLRCRLMAAGNCARCQPSLFDGIDHVPLDFVPLVAKPQRRSVDCDPEPEQLMLLS